jgi:hypothetical protein
MENSVTKFTKYKSTVMTKWIVILMLLVGGFSCTEDLSDCPSKMCVIANSWKLTLVLADNEIESSDLSQYKLTLNFPIPVDASTSSFTRTQVSGQTDSGTWSIENNGTVLRLVPDNNTLFSEDWIIESFSPRQLILILNRDVSFKQGPSLLKFVLEPAN